MKALQSEINDWQERTFGPPASLARTCVRLIEEAVELLDESVTTGDREVRTCLQALGNVVELMRVIAIEKADILTDPNEVDWQRIGSEIADNQHLIFDVARAAGVDVETVTRRKFAINLHRKWKPDGTGHGYHE